MNKTIKYIYVASPYSHTDATVREGRFKLIAKICARLFKDGKIFFGPILQSHPLAIEGGIEETTWDMFSKFDCAWIDKCDEVWVMKIPGWEESVGVRAEINYAHNTGVPVFYLDVYPESGLYSHPQKVSYNGSIV